MSVVIAAVVEQAEGGVEGVAHQPGKNKKEEYDDNPIYNTIPCLVFIILDCKPPVIETIQVFKESIRYILLFWLYWISTLSDAMSIELDEL